MSLDRADRVKIEFASKEIARIAESCVGSPFDPKVEILLELAHAWLQEQLELDKKYGKWSKPAERDDRFIDGDIPSADDIRRMMEGE
jgi:hypothetical protein